MHKALVHNCAQSYKVTKIHVFSQPQTDNSSQINIDLNESPNLCYEHDLQRNKPLSRPKQPGHTQ